MHLDPTLPVACRSARCRICGHRGLRPVLDLGKMPLTAAFVPPGPRSGPEPRYLLQVAFCPECALMQVLQTLPPEAVFHTDYPYYSSFSEAMLAHSRELADELTTRQGLTSESLVVELASNDGYLLQYFVRRNIPVLGIDPAQGPAAAAQQLGIRTLCRFFTRELAEELISQNAQADALIANNVLAHVADTNGFVSGIRMLLKAHATAVIEVPYVRDLIERCEFDTIYHEHLCYFSVTALDHLFRRNGLYLNEVRHVPIHGGSLRLYVGRSDCPHQSVRRLLDEERADGLSDYAYYSNFGQRVADLRERLRAVLLDLRRQGRTIAVYGAAAKGVILLNYLQVEPGTIAFAVDRNPHKHGQFMPGLGIEVFPPEHLLEHRPDVTLVLAWNFSEEILRQQQAYRDAGGRFLIPVTAPRFA